MPRRSPTRGKSHLRAISKHKKTRRTKRKRDLAERRWRHPKTGARDRFSSMRAKARDEYGRTHKWLVSLGIKQNWKISPKRKFTIGKKVDELTTLLGKMSVKKSRSTAKNLSKLFKGMSVKKSQRSRSRRKKSR